MAMIVLKKISKEYSETLKLRDNYVNLCTLRTHRRTIHSSYGP